MRTCERQYVRVEYPREVQLTTADNLKLIVHCENVSAGGLSIRCDQITAAAMMPLGYQLNPSNPLLLSIELCLDDAKLEAICGIKNSYRSAENSFCFNLKFIAFEKNSQQCLDNFMKKQKFDV